MTFVFGDAAFPIVRFGSTTVAVTVFEEPIRGLEIPSPSVSIREPKLLSSVVPV